MKKENDRKKILLVDDDVDYLTVTRTRLEASGYEVACAENGRAALEYLDRETPPSLIVMDVEMPDKNGLTTLVHLNIRSNGKPEEQKKIPVIVATGLDGEAIKHILLDQKISGYMKKPIDSGELVRKIKELIG